MSRAWPYFALFASGLCWGLGLPFGKLALAQTDASHMILLRFAVAGLAVAPLALRTESGRRLLRRPAVLMSGTCYAVGFLLQFEGLAHSSVAVCALLVGGMPTLIATAAALRGERVGRVAWVGIVAATLGAVDSCLTKREVGRSEASLCWTLPEFSSARVGSTRIETSISRSMAASRRRSPASCSIPIRILSFSRIK